MDRVLDEPLGRNIVKGRYDLQIRRNGQLRSAPYLGLNELTDLLLHTTI